MLLLSSLAFASGPDTTIPPVGQKAGKITALLPTAHVVRGAGKKAVTTDAVKGEDLVWQDLVKTDKGGRARITLADQSILSLGSQAELRIVKHDARAQQTALEMTYGRIRAQVSSITRDGGSFQLRTPTAVAGVIGTDFGTDASVPGVTTLLCISGTVQVGNSDPSVPGTVPCTAGQTTTIKSGLPPTPPVPATQQQINQLIADTEPAVISAFAPASALVGATVDTVATGTHMSGINGATIAGSGVQVTLGPNGTDTTAVAHLVIAPTAQPGPRAVTFTKPNGADTAAIFTVIAPPALQGTDSASLQKRYTDILNTELQAADASNASIKSALQQEADRGLQTIQENDSKLPQPVSTDQISQQLNNIVAGVSASGTTRETQAYNTATAAIAQIVAAILPKIQDGSEPTANLGTDLDKQFAPINDAFQSALSQIHTDLAAQSSTQIQAIDQLVANFEQTLTAAAQQQAAPPVPKVDSQDRSYEAGFQGSFDAGGSTALGGASVAGVSWVLCDPSYKPAQVGVVLPANPPACRPVPGFAASGGQFQFDTCDLNPGDYTARVTVADSSGKASAMDVRLHILQPGYDDPATRLLGLANAYIALQSQQFLAFFDPTYPGLTQLQESIRNTFLTLDTMQINLRVSQSSITCNSASLRADWQQIYTFKSDQTCANAQAGTACQKVLFRQSEQLTARMTRTPGKGWFITDFQGDNGTVQGVPPGPQTSFAAQPSLQVTGLQITIASTTQQSNLRTQRATSVSVIGLAPGINHFVATVTNIGKAPLTQQPQLRFSVFDASNNEIAGDTENLPTLPLNPGASETVTGTITVPALAPSTPVNIGANVNPGCLVQEQNCGLKNVTVLPAVAGTIDLGVTAITPTGQYVGTLNGTVNVTISNNGTAPSSASTGNLVLTSPDFQGTLATANIPSVPANGSVVVPLIFTVPNSPGLHNIKVSITPPAAGDNNPGNDSATGSLNFTVADRYTITSIASATTPNPPTGANALQVGQNVTVQITVANTGTTSPTGNISVQFNCTIPATCQLSNPPTATIAAPAAGQSAVATVTINNLQLPPAPGYVATATITSSPTESTTAGNSATVTFDVTDFTLTNSLGFTGDLNVQVGSQGFFNVSLAEPQGLTAISIPVTVTPAIGGVNYAVNSPLTPGTPTPVVILTNSTAPFGTSSPVTVTGSHFGVSHTTAQSVRFFTASLENFSAGQPGSSQNQPIILPINGAAQPLNLRLTGNFFNPGGGAQLGFPTVTGLSFTPSQTTAAAGDVISVQMQAVQGAAVNQTVPIVFTAQVPNMNPPVPQTLTVFVRPTALPDLAVTSVAVASRNFSANPWLSGEPLDFVVTVANNGPGPSNGFENLHLLLNGSELTRGGVTVPQALQPNTSVNVTVHLDAPDPVATASSTLTAKVDEDTIGDANPSNDSLAISVSTSDWGLTIPLLPTGGPSGSNDTLALSVPAGGSSTTFIQPTISGKGDFLTPVSVLNGIVSSRITETPGASSFTTQSTQISDVISAATNAAQGFYAAQVIARFVDGGRPTAQRQATVHISVQNANSPGDSVTVTSSSNNACTSGCNTVEINGLLIDNLNLTVTRNSGQTTGSVDLHFTDPGTIVSDVTSTGAPQTPIINGVAYGVPTNVYFAAAQNATGAVTPGAGSVVVSATSIQTSAARGIPTPDPVGPNQTQLQFSVGDLSLGTQSPACFNIAPGQSGTLTLNFSPLGGFNAPSISWNVSSLPAGVVLGSVTPTSTFNGSSYSPINIVLQNSNPADITPSQPFTLVGTISNANGSASVIFAPTVQLHSGACVPGGLANVMVEGGVTAGGTRGVWRRGGATGGVARTNIIRDPSTTPGDVRLVAGDVSYTPSLPKAGDTVQVRFRLTNSGTTEARDVPVALLVNGTVVVSDNFDVGPGKTALGGLQWINAQLPRTAMEAREFAMLVVDPVHNARAGLASGKVAPLLHFALAGGITGGAPLQALAGGRQRALIEIAESACAGFRFASGASSSCGSSDVEISFDDAASGRFSLRSNRGIADLGMNTSGTSTAGAQYTSQLIAAAGHAYAVQLDGGRVGVLTIRAIRNPRQNGATADKVFHGGAAGRLAGKIGRKAGPVDTGEVSGAQTHDAVVAVLDVLYDNP
jgi:hypothetical protein